MNQQDLQAVTAATSRLGEQTRASVVIELTHDGQVHINPFGQLMDLSFMSQNLQWLVLELLAGRVGPDKSPTSGPMP